MDTFLLILGAAFLGAYIGRFLSFSAEELPKILFDESQEREPSEVFTLFFNHPITQYGGLREKCLELICATFFGATVAYFGISLASLFVLAATSLLIGCFLTDYDHAILPDQFTIPLLWLGLTASLIPIFVTPEEAIIGAVAGYGFFWGMNVIYRSVRRMEGMYPGDFKLNAALGGCLGLKYLIPVILISFTCLVIFSMAHYIIKTRKLDMSLFFEESPYGCYSSLISIIVLYQLLMG